MSESTVEITASTCVHPAKSVSVPKEISCPGWNTCKAPSPYLFSEATVPLALAEIVIAVPV